MEAEFGRYIAQGLAVLSMAGSAFAEGHLFGKGFEAIGRNPELENSLFPKMIIAAAICESTAIYALVAFFLLA